MGADLKNKPPPVQFTFCFFFWSVNYKFSEADRECVTVTVQKNQFDLMNHDQAAR